MKKWRTAFLLMVFWMFVSCGIPQRHDLSVTSDKDSRLDKKDQDTPQSPATITSRQVTPAERQEHDSYRESDPSECKSWCIVPVDRWLEPDLEDNEVLARLGPPDKKSELVYEPATGLDKQFWEYRSLGLHLEMTKDGDSPLSVYLISVTGDSKLMTPGEIGIGSTRKEVEALYGTQSNPDYTDERRLVIGSIYWGTGFYFEDGVVSHILIGVTHGN